MENLTGQCRRARRLRELAAEGRILTADERAFLRTHEAECPLCGTDAFLEGLAAYRGPDTSPLQPLDDVSRRRRVQDVVERAFQQPAGQESRRNRLSWALAGGALAAAAAVALVVLWPRHGGAPRTHRFPPRPEPPRVLLVSGRVRLPARLGPGATFETQQGKLAMWLPCGASVLADEHTRLQLRRWDKSSADILLSRGRLVVSVSHRPRPVRFVVHTPYDTVKVRGTVFSVVAGSTSTRVRVVRGVVAVTSRAGSQHLVPAGREYETDIGVRTLADSAARSLRSEWRTLEAMAHGQTTLVLDSVPAGASVRLDGRPVGTTPLRVTTSPGRHELRLAATGWQPRRLEVELPEGGGVRRQVHLVAVGASAGEEGAPTTRQNERERPSGTQPTADGTKKGASSSPRAQANRLTPRQLLVRARRLRAQGKLQEASRTYARLLQLWPHSSAARTARVLLGWMALRDLGRPGEALSHFDAYLRHGGPLAQEALYGSILALRRLGRRREEADRIRRFLRQYPSALQVPALRRRLEKLEER